MNFDPKNILEALSTEKLLYLIDKVQQMAHLGFWETDLITNENWWSPQVYSLFHFNTSEGAPTIELALTRIHPDDLSGLVKARLQAIKEKRGYFYQFRIVRPDGSTIHVENTAQVHLDELAKPVKLFGILQDITERINQEKLIADQKLKMSAASSLTALGEMASSIAHEVNNPLTIILGKIEKIKKIAIIANSELAMKELTAVEKSSMKIAAIISTLQRLTEETNFTEKQILSTVDIIQSALSLCHEKIVTAGIKLEVHIDPDLNIEANLAELTKVILAMLSNAFDAIHEMQSPWIKIEASRKTHGDIFIAISDSGHGISKDISGKIMTPFFTTKPVGKGTGLGLSLSQQIIKDHGGTLFLDHFSENTKFVIRLPSAEIHAFIPTTIDEAIDAHLAWRQKLLSYFANPNGSLDSNVISSDCLCSLGRWIYSQNSFSQDDKIFLKVKEAHLAFHICAGNLVKRVNAGEDLLGEVVLDNKSEYAKLSFEVIESLRILKSKFETKKSA